MKVVVNRLCIFRISNLLLRLFRHSKLAIDPSVLGQSWISPTILANTHLEGSRRSSILFYHGESLKAISLAKIRD
nr:hypothetical protein Q903MT_gene4584 [Picea sitchensis]